MQIQGVYPVLGTEDMQAARDFWVDHFGFSVTFEADWYVSLRRDPEGHELALLEHAHPTVPEGFRYPARGVLVNVEVDDVDGEWERLVVRGGLDVALPLRSETFGQRHFIVVSPGGVLVDVITQISPGEEYVPAYSQGGR